MGVLFERENDSVGYITGTSKRYFCNFDIKEFDGGRSIEGASNSERTL